MKKPLVNQDGFPPIYILTSPPAQFLLCTLESKQSSVKYIGYSGYTLLFVNFLYKMTDVLNKIFSK